MYMKFKIFQLKHAIYRVQRFLGAKCGKMCSLIIVNTDNTLDYVKISTVSKIDNKACCMYQTIVK